MRKLSLVVALSLLGTGAFAQWGFDELSEQPTTRERLFVGGGLGLSLSSYSIYVGVSPLIGYNITTRLAGGLQIIYRYTNYKGSPSISVSDYGMAPFARFMVYKPFFVHMEYEYLNYEYPTSATESIRKYYNSVIGGVGYFQPFAPRGGFYMMALYNFSYQQSTSSTDYTPYNTPLLFRAGVTFGL
ncbi:MAG: hypothetical protein WKF87_21340 [Chryseolinea sp.]